MSGRKRYSTTRGSGDSRPFTVPRTLQEVDLLDRLLDDYTLRRVMRYRGDRWRYLLRHRESGRTIELKAVNVMNVVRAGYITATVSAFDQQEMLFTLTDAGRTRIDAAR